MGFPALDPACWCSSPMGVHGLCAPAEQPPVAVQLQRAPGWDLATHSGVASVLHLSLPVQPLLPSPPWPAGLINSTSSWLARRATP